MKTTSLIKTLSKSLMSITILSMAVLAGFAQGMTPISSCADLQLMDGSTGDFFLANNIGSESEPCTNMVNTFRGSLNGAGQEIWIDMIGVSNGGLFGQIDGAEIYDLTLYGSVQGPYCVGMLAGDVGSSSIWNITIANASISADTDVGGLIGCLEDGVEISDIRIENTDISAGNGYAGGLIGRIGDANILDISGITISDLTISGDHNIGGLIGEIDTVNDLRISDVLLYNVEIFGEYQVGGLIGLMESVVGSIHEVVIDNGGIENQDASSVGGLIGYMTDSTLDVSYFALLNNNVYGMADVGGFVGNINNSSLSFDHSLINTSFVGRRGSADGDAMGGLLGYTILSTILLENSYLSIYSLGADSAEVGLVMGDGRGNNISLDTIHFLVPNMLGDVVMLNAGEYTSVNDSFWIEDGQSYTLSADLSTAGVSIVALADAESELIDAGWDFDGTWTMSDIIVGEDIPQLQWILYYYLGGGFDDRTHVYSCADLGSNISNGWYDVVLSFEGDVLDCSSYGNDVMIENFAGYFDGNGKTIIVDIDNGTNRRAGFFQGLDGETTIENLSIQGTIVGQDVVGGLVGLTYYNLYLYNVHVQVDIVGRNLVGGLVGASEATVYIVDSSYIGTIEALNIAGGFIGETFLSSIYIENSSAQASIYGESILGGFVGLIYDSNIEIRQSYALPQISGDGSSLGGFWGESYLSNMSISNSYVIGSINIFDPEENPYGENISINTVNNSYALINGEYAYLDMTPINAEEISNIATFADADWDIETIFMDRNNGMPFLAWEVGADSAIWYISGGSNDDDEDDEVIIITPPSGCSGCGGVFFYDSRSSLSFPQQVVSRLSVFWKDLGPDQIRTNIRAIITMYHEVAKKDTVTEDMKKVYADVITELLLQYRDIMIQQ